MVVRTKAPAVPPPAGDREEPVPSKMSVLPSPGPGGAKLAWLRMLNISTRNWTLKVSDILCTLKFLNTEKSRLVMPGPVRMFRPAFPRRLKHCGNTAATGIGFGLDAVGIG